MGRKKKYLILGTILVMAVAFAAVTTTLVMRGNLAIGINKNDYAIYFSKSIINSEDVSKKTISTNGQTLTFDAEMRELGQVTELDYEVTNASKNYDARVSIECRVSEVSEEETGLDIEKYIDIKYENLDDIIPARQVGNGTITITLKRSMVEEMKIGLNCDLSFDAEERDSLALNYPEGTDPSEYNFSGYLVDKDDNILPNINMVMIENKNIYITTGEDADLKIEGLDMGYHEIYILSGNIEDIKKMSDEEIKNNAIAKAKFPQSSKQIGFDNGYKIVDELVKKEYKLTFDAQGGSVDPKTKIVIYRDTYGELPTPTLRGYNFQGWYTDTEYTEEIKEKTKVDLKEDATVYAKWEAIIYTVNFDSAGGNEVASKKLKYNTVYGELETPVKKNYNFMGWYLGNTLITSTTRFRSITDVTLIARWESKKKKITVDIDGVITEIEIDLSKPIIESLPKQEKEGYEFDGWYKEPEEEKLKDDEFLDEDEELKIHTKFKAKKYTVTFDAMIGNVGTPTKEVTYDDVYGELPEAKRAGYNFLGWFTEKDGGMQVTKDTVVKLSGNQTLYAHLVAKDDIVYTIRHWQQKLDSFDVPKNESNYTLVNTETNTGTTDATVTPNTNTYEGFTAPSKESITIKADGTSEVNYYYTRNTYTLTVNKDVGITDLTSKTSYQYGEDVNIGYTVKPGYTLVGITGDKTTNTFTMPASNVTMSISTTENVYTITYELNGGALDGENPSEYKVTSNDITLKNPTRDGYTFMGWTGSNGEVPSKNITIAKGSIGNRNYTANFNPNTFTIAFDANGGNEITTVLTVTYDATFGNTLPVPTRVGYTFDGWFTEETGGSQVTSTTKVDLSENKTLYAHWTVKTYEVTINTFGGGSATPTKVLVDYSGTNTLTVTPDNGYYLSSLSCTNGYTTNAKVGYDYQAAQTVTISNNDNDKTSVCTVNFNPTNELMERVATDKIWQHSADIKNISFETTMNPKANAAYTYDLSRAQNETVMSYLVPNTEDTTKYDLYIQSKGRTVANENSTRLFYSFINTENINNLENLDTSHVTNMYAMFSNLNNLTSLDVSSLDTSNVTNMGWLFGIEGTHKELGSKLTTIKGLEKLDTSKVTSMLSMFINESNLTNLNLSNFNTSNVTTMLQMFYNCNNLASLDVSKFDTSNVTTMESMFYNCDSLISLDVSNFDTSKVTSMGWMFYDCDNLKELDLSNFTTKNVTQMKSMFCNDKKLVSLNVSNFDVSNVTDMSFMFCENNSLKELDLSSFNPINVTTMYRMFYNASNITSLNLSNFNTKSVTTMQQMFYNCNNLTSLDLSGFDTSNVTNMESMFYNVSSLINLDVSNFNTGQVTSMGWMFYGCESLKELDLSNFDTKNVTQMKSMFNNDKKLVSLDVSNFNVSNVTDMSYMFYENNSLKTLDLSSFNPINVTTMYRMFYNASDLTSINLSNFNTKSVTTMDSMFSGCSSLVNLDLRKFDTSNVTIMSSMFSNCHNLQAVNTTSFNTSNVTKMNSMFHATNSIGVIDVSNFDTSKVTDMSWLFGIGSSYVSLGDKLTEIKGLNNLNTSNVTNMASMFFNRSNISTLDVSNFNTSKITKMSSMFSNMDNLTSIDVSSFDTSNVTDMSYMFSVSDSGDNLRKSKLTEIKGLENFNTSKVTNMKSMFYKLDELTSLDVSSFDTSNVTDMSFMFGSYSKEGERSNNKLAEIKGLENFKTSKVTKMNSMFQSLESLTSLNVSAFDTSNVTDMGYMFVNCHSLTNLNLSNFNTNKVTRTESMFGSCNKLTSLDISSFNISLVTSSDKMFRNLPSNIKIKVKSTAVRTWALATTENSLTSSNFTVVS